MFIVSLISISSAIGYFTMPPIDGWYKGIRRSSLTPPNYFFPIVWNILYTLIAISGWLMFNSKPFSNLNIIKILYIIQLLLNWAWSPLFFSYHLLGVAMIVILLMDIFVASIVFLAYEKLKLVSILMLPYLLWILFATYLSFYIFKNN